MIGDHPDRDDLVAYSLGALEPAEEREVEAHAPGCARCSRELEALAPAVGVLGESVEQLEPPAELRERVMAEVHADVAQAAAARERGVEAAPQRRERRGWRGLLLRPAIGLAALAVAVAGVGGYLVADNGGGGGVGGETVAVQPGPAGSGIGGTLAIGESSSTLDLDGLRQLSGREVYQVWVAKGQSLRPSSDFVPDANGRAAAAIEGHLSGGTRVMVTREPHAGRTTPTPPILLSATVQ